MTGDGEDAEEVPSPPPTPVTLSASSSVSPRRLERLSDDVMPEPPPLPLYLQNILMPPLPPLPRGASPISESEAEPTLQLLSLRPIQSNISGNRRSSEGGIISPGLDSVAHSVDFNLHDDIYEDEDDEAEPDGRPEYEEPEVRLPHALMPKGEAYTPTPYSPQMLFRDNDNRCGNSLNKFYGLKDIMWYQVWQHTGNTRSVYNLRHDPLWIIPKTCPLRITAIKIVDSAYFRWTVLAIITLNAVTLAMDIPETHGNHAIQKLLSVTNIMFLAAFTIEASLKVVAMGFVLHSHAYLQSSWNCLDFILLIAGYASLHPSMANYTVVRLVRLLRPLRTVSRVPGLSALLSALFGALPHMGNILLLMSFLLTIFSIIGVQLWQSGWDNRCYLYDNATDTYELIQNYTRGCVIGTHFYGALSCDAQYNGVTGNQSCHRDTSQFHESTLNFDNFATASLLLFKIISLDDWPTDLKRTQDAFGWWSWIYFFLLTVFGSFVCVNLMLAAMTIVLEEERKEDKKRETEEVFTSGASSPRRAPPLEQITVVTEIAKKDSEAITHDAKGKRNMTLEGAALIDVPSGIRVTNIAVSTVTFSLVRLPTAVYLSACLANSSGWPGRSRAGTDSESLTALRHALTRARRCSIGSQSSSPSPKPRRRTVKNQHVMFEFDVPPLNLTTDTDDEERRLQAEQFEDELQNSSNKPAPPSPTRRSLYRPQGDVWTTEQKSVLRMGGAGAAVAIKPLSYWRNQLRAVVTSKVVSRYMLFITCFNVTVLCTDSYNIDPQREYFIELTNFICNLHFMLELVLKLSAMGWKEYMSDNYNVCDFLLVLISIPEMVLSKGSAASAVRAVRLFRLARILRVGARLLPRLKSLRVILVTMVASFREAGYIMLVMILLILVYTIIGIQLFEGSMGNSRNTFNSLWEAALTVFIIISGEGWGKTMKAGIDNNSAAAAIYFVSLFTIGNYILLNLFTSVVIFNFKNCDERDTNQGGVSQADRATELASHSSMLRYKLAKTVLLASQSDVDQPLSLPPRSNTGQSTLPDDMSQPTSGLTESMTPGSAPSFNSRKFMSPLVLDRQDSRLCTEPSDILGRQSSRKIDKSVSMLTERPAVSDLIWVDDWARGGKELSTAKVEKQGTETSVSSRIALFGVSLGLFPPDHWLRVFLANFVCHKQFNNMISVLIVLNCISIALSDPWWDQDPDRRLALDICDYVFTTLFIVEMCAKIIVYGLWEKYETPDDDVNSTESDAAFAVELIERDAENQPYLRCTWNRIDLFVVCVAVVGFFVKEFKIFRSFRAIRIVIRSENIKIVVLAILHALPTMGNIVIVLLFLFVIFAAIGIQLFKGTLWYCTDMVSDEVHCNGTWFEDVPGIGLVEQPREWVNPRTNFDNLGYAMLTLFQLSLCEGWVDIMYRGVDAGNPGDARKVNQRPYNAIYYVMFIMVGTFFAMNLFIGMLVEKFNEITRYFNGHVFLTPQQVTWVQTAKVLHRAKISPKPKMPSNPFRKSLYLLVGHPCFDPIITFCILANVVAMMAVHRDQSEEFSHVLEVVNLVLLCVYTVEAALKLVAWGLVHYMSDNWNKFDFTIMVVSWIGVVFLNSPLASVFRVLRVGRMFRLVHKANGIRQMLFTLYYSLPPLLNLSMLFIVALFIYGAMGVKLFGKVRLQGGLDEQSNFSSMPKAIVTLFVISTAETWPDVMEACRFTSPDCDGDCGTEWALPYFISFMMVGYVISLNLFITIIIEVLEHQRSQIELLNTVDTFKAKWIKFDDEATERVTWRQLLMILRVLPPPIGMPSATRATSTYLTNLRIPISVEGHVRYIDAVYGLARLSLSVEAIEARQLADRGFTTGPTVSGIVISLHHVYYVTIVQKWWRVTKMKRILNQTVLEVSSPRRLDLQRPRVEEVDDEANPGKGAVPEAPPPARSVSTSTSTVSSCDDEEVDTCTPGSNIIVKIATPETSPRTSAASDAGTNEANNGSQDMVSAHTEPQNQDDSSRDADDGLEGLLRGESGEGVDAQDVEAGE